MRIRLLYPLLLLLTLCGCQDNALLDNSIESGNAVPVKLVLSLNEQTPVTRSAFADFNAPTLDDVSILIYSNDGNQLIDLCYYNELNFLAETSSCVLSLNLNASPGLHKIYVVANWGSSMEELDVSTESNLKALQLTDRTTNGIPSTNIPLFCAVGASDADIYSAGSTNITSGISINAQLKRLVSRITVKVDDSNLTSGVKVTPTKIALLQVPTTVTLGKNEPASSFAAAGDFQLITTAELPRILQSSIAQSSTPTFNPHAPGNNGISLFMLENMQGEGVETTDQKLKEPLAGKSSFVTYLEVTASFINTTGVGAASGIIKYKLYLGNDIYRNMDVQRNTHYLVTLNLKGDGGLSESSWRVEKSSLSGWSTAPTVHVGYYPDNAGQIRILFNTETERNYAVATNAITIGVSKNLNFSNNGVPITYNIAFSGLTADLSNPLCAILPFTISGLANIYYEERDYATLTIQNPNAAVYENLTVKIRQGAMPKGVGIYRSEGSTTVFHADATNLKLKSYGKWTVRVLTNSPFQSSWMQLGGTSIDASGNHLASLSDSQNILGLNKVISGGSDLTEEWIHFDFKPSGTVSASAVRGGVIEILYNNNLSKHYMYVRQGYAPVQLNISSTANAYWSSYNTYGRNRNANSYPTFMNSPFEVGYMFRIGSNNGINPYSPGWDGATIYSISLTNPVSISEGGICSSWNDFGTLASNKWRNKENPHKDAYPSPEGYKSPTYEEAIGYLQFDFNTSPEHGVFGCVYDDSNKPYWGMLVRQMAGISAPDPSGISVFFPTGGSRLGGTSGGALFYGGPSYRDNGNPRYGTHYILEDGYYIDVYSNYNNLMGITIRSSNEIINPVFWDRGCQVRCVKASADAPYPGGIQPAEYTISDATTGYPLAD